MENTIETSKEVEKVNNLPAKSKQAQVKDLLLNHREQIAQALPRHIRADHFIRTAITCINKTPKLLECSIPSLMGALITSAQLGLNPDGITGEAYLIPFSNSKKKPNGQWEKVMEVQFIPGYRGLVQLAMRSGIVKSFQAREVYENDKFEYEFGLEPKLIHVPVKVGERGILTYVYAVVHFTNGGSAFEVMNINEVAMIRMKSKAPNSPAWTEFFPEMAKKTVIRKISKMCPLSPEFNKAIGLDETAEFLGSQKTERELINYEVDQTIASQIDDDISQESEIAEEDINQEIQEAKETKVNDAVQQSLDMIEKKKGGKK
jgi:recombination protein RecT